MIRIAQVAPLYESVPPKLYGGTERVVHYLTEELVKKGHDVTLFASGDSVTSAELVSHLNEGLRLNLNCVDPLAHHFIQLQEVFERADDFDIIHFHTDYLHFPFAKHLNVPCVTTLHGRLDLSDLQPLYNKFNREKVISISRNQREPLPQANWIGTVLHGLPKELHCCGSGDGGYLAFLGRISPEKGLERAVEIAIRSNIKLKIAAKVDKVDEPYFEKEIKPLFEHPLIEFIGEINEIQKTEFLGKAKALIFPINWPEPFGMVMIEAMSCGTPVVAFKNGSVPEVVDEGKTGFIVSSTDEAVDAVARIDGLSRLNVRRVFEERFTASRMADDYLKLYKKTIHNARLAKRVNLKPLKSSLINQEAEVV